MFTRQLPVIEPVEGVLLLQEYRHATVTPSSLVGGGDHDEWSPIFVFWGRLHLVRREIERDAVVLRGRKVVERVPIDRDLAVTDPQEAPKVDDRSTHLSAPIDDYIDDPPHIFSGDAADLPAQHRLDVLPFEHRGGLIGRGPTRCLTRRFFRGLGELRPWRELPRVIISGGGRRAQRYGCDS
jgi:hypothetical protein